MNKDFQHHFSLGRAPEARECVHTHMRIPSADITNNQPKMTQSQEEFIKLIEEMRGLQKLYFKTRSVSILDKAKAMEKQVDQEIKRLKDEFKRDATQLDFNFD